MKIEVKRGTHWHNARRRKNDHLTATLCREDGTPVVDVDGPKGAFDKDAKQAVKDALLEALAECASTPVVVMPYPTDDGRVPVAVARRVVAGWMIQYGAGGVGGTRFELGSELVSEVAYNLAKHGLTLLAEGDERRQTIYAHAHAYGVVGDLANKLRREVAHHDAWQRRYREAERRGAGDPHSVASRDPRLRPGTPDWMVYEAMQADGFFEEVQP